MQQETKLVKKFDKTGKGWLDAAERKAAREFLTKEGPQGFDGPGRRRGGFFGPRDSQQTKPQPGPRIAPGDIKLFPDATLYSSNALRTFFLEFEDADWEKELAEFKHTDVEVLANLTVDGKTYRDVGVHFHGTSSFMMVGEGHKRSLVLTMGLAHDKQRLYGYRKINLLNSHEDPSFMRTVLSLQIAREYLPAPKANYGRVVINGESWGLYVNQEHFDKDFTKEFFGTAKGSRWKVQGSPNGQGGLNYLGEDSAPYRRIYQIKSNDDPKAWASLIRLCKVLEESPTEQLEQALASLLDIDGTLRFLAWDNSLVNDDGFWTRASDYDLFLDEQGRFHIIPYDANETFSFGGGPGGPRGPGGPGLRGGFGPGMLLTKSFLEQADADADQKLTRQEFVGLADQWSHKLDLAGSASISQEQFVKKLSDFLSLPTGPGPEGFAPPTEGREPGGRGGFGPANFIGPGLFKAMDANKDGGLTAAEVQETFGKWFTQWDSKKTGHLDEDSIRDGLNAALPGPDFGPGGRRGPGGPRFARGPGAGGVNLDPLVSLNDTSKPLVSKLLAVPSLKARYLGYIREIADKSLDWNKLGSTIHQYENLIQDDVKADTRKLDSLEDFESAVSSESQPAGTHSNNLKQFVEQRRVFLLNHAEVKKAGM